MEKKLCTFERFILTAEGFFANQPDERSFLRARGTQLKRESDIQNERA